MATPRSQKSTNVRFMKSLLTVAEVVAPDWLEKKAFHAFGHPMKHAGRWGELEQLGRHFTDEGLQFWEWNALEATRGSERSRARAAGDVHRSEARSDEGEATRETVLLVHGWSGNAAQMRAFVEPLVATGHHVVALDLPAHGSSEGDFATLVSLAERLRSIVLRFQPRAIVAHSFGATVTVRALQRGPKVECVVLLAPPVELPPYLRHFAGEFGLSETMVQRLLARIDRDVMGPLGERIIDLDLRRVAPALGDVEALIIHDRADLVTPAASSKQLAAAWPGAEFHETFGLGHDGVRKAREVVARVVSFVREGRHKAAESRALAG